MSHNSQDSPIRMLPLLLLISQSCLTLRDPKDCSPPGFSVRGRVGSQVSPRGDLPNPGIEPTSTALQVNSLLLSHQGSPCCKNPRDTNAPSAVVDRPCSNLTFRSHHGGIGTIPHFPFSVDPFRAPLQ